MKSHLLTLSTVLAVSASVSSQAGILLNEVHLNPPNGTDLGDRNFEFIELRSTLTTADKTESTSGLTLLIINNDRWDYKTNDQGVEVATVLNLGEVSEAWSLEDMHTGTNGLLLLGDKYTEIPKGGPWAGFIDPATEVGDPPGMGEGNIKSNDGLTIYLVSGYTNPAPNSGTPGNEAADFDVDNNGIFDWTQATVPAGGYTTQPWTATLDRIGTRDRNSTAWPVGTPIPPGAVVTGIMEPYVPASANINVYALTTPPTWSIGDRDPESFSRNASLLSSGTASAWYGGKFVDPLPDTDPANSTAYRDNRVFGLANGLATPGRVNLSTAPPLADFRINEVNLDPSSDRFQYIEIINTNSPSGSRSLNGYWLVLVDSNVSTSDATLPNKVGTVLEEWDLSAMATGTNGLLVIADDASSSFNVFEDFMPAETGKGDPIGSNSNPKSTGFGAGDISSKSGFSLMLIRGYKSAVADAALAPGRDIDVNEDGLVDFGAFGTSFTIIDSIGFDMAALQASGAGKTYALVNLRTVFPEFTATDGNKACDNFSRKTNTSGVPITTNVVNSWYGGEFPPSAGFNLAYQPPQSDQATVNNPSGTTHFGGYRGAATPGRANLSAPINAAAPPVAADIRINEVMFDATDKQVDSDPNNTDLDGNRDYIELISSNRAIAYLDGIWVLVIDNAGSNKGVVFKGAPLDGQTTGLNGVLLLGDNYDDPTSVPYVATEGVLPPATATVDPVVAFGGDDIPGKGATILLIRGNSYDPAAAPNGPFKVGGPVTIGANLKPSGDLDPDNDGVLLAPSEWLAPDAVVVDAISIGSIDPGPGYGWISSAWLPDCAARYPGDARTATPAAWYYGQIDQTANPVFPSTAFTSNYSGTFQGNASPGRWNHAAAVGAVTPGAILINECHFNPAGGDGSFEFIELIDRNLASRSLNGYSLVMIDNVKNNTGTVQRAWSLDGFYTGSNGLSVVTNGTSVTSPFAPVFRVQSTVGDPPGRNDLISGFGEATIATESDNQSVMLLLVRNFTSYLGADLDAFANGVDSSGDGIFDNAGAAWESGVVHDSIVLRSWLPAEVGPPAVPAQWNGFTYNLADLSGTFFPNPATLFYHPETVGRFRGNLDANAGSAWYAGDLVGGASGKLGTDTAYVTNLATNPPVPVGFLGRTTPGQPNISTAETGDADADGIATLIEEALGSDPYARDSFNPLPVVGQTDVGGSLYGTISYRRIKSGTAAADKSYAAEAFTYTVQTSTDLVNWTANGSTISQVGTATANPDGVTETVTFRLTTPTSDPAGRAYLRLKIGRQ